MHCGGTHHSAISVRVTISDHTQRDAIDVIILLDSVLALTLLL